MITPSYVGTVLKHDNSLGRPCIMSGQPYPAAEL